MNKKSLLMMMVTICLIAVVGVGSTLAYLSDKTDVMTNTFTVGSGIQVAQDESDESTPDNTEDRTSTGNSYTDILPGQTLVKDPTAIVLANSTECYVFMELEGADALAAQGFTFNGFDGEVWNKVSGEGLDGVYCYNTTVAKSDADQRLAPLFTSVTYSIEATETDVELSDVTVKTCAVQAAEMDAAAALDAAVAEMSK